MMHQTARGNRAFCKPHEVLLFHNSLGAETIPEFNGDEKLTQLVTERCKHAQLGRDKRQVLHSRVKLRNLSDEIVAEKAFAFILSMGNMPYLRDVLGALIEMRIFIIAGQRNSEHVPRPIAAMCSCQLFCNRDARVVSSSIWCHNVAEGLQHFTADRRMVHMDSSPCDQQSELMTTSPLPTWLKSASASLYVATKQSCPPSILPFCKHKRTKINHVVISILDQLHKRRKGRIVDLVLPDHHAKLTEKQHYYIWALSACQGLFLVEVVDCSSKELNNFLIDEYTLYAGPLLDCWINGTHPSVAQYQTSVYTNKICE